MKWTLASASPRRRELLKEFIPDFAVIPAKGEEKAENGLTPSALVCALAEQKAAEVAALPAAANTAVIGSDTVVVFGDDVLGKPQDKSDAKRMLTLLSGRVHQVYTGVCILLPDGRKLIEADCTDVEFEVLTEAQIDAYIATGSPMDKAGAYGIQDGGIVKEIRGSYSNVVGFPCELFQTMLQRVK